MSKEIWRSQIPKKLCKKFRSWKTSQSRCQDDQHIKHKHGNDAIISRKTPKSFSCTLGHVWPSEKRNRTRKIEIVCAGNQIFRFSFIIFVFLPTSTDRGWPFWKMKVILSEQLTQFFPRESQEWTNERTGMYPTSGHYLIFDCENQNRNFGEVSN